MSENESLLIRRLRFPLMAAVVFIHTDFRIVRPELRSLPFFAETMSVFVDFVCGAAVPLFFFFSGYLLHFSSKQHTFWQVLRRKVRSLIVPYVLWIALCILLIALCQAFIPSFRLLLHKSINDCSIPDFLWMFWDISRATGIDTDQQGPLVGQFWFLQCLMVLTLISPLLRRLVRHLPVITLSILFVVNTWQLLPHYPGIHAGAFFYFTAGTAFATHRPQFTPLLQRWGWGALPIFLILYILKHHLMPWLPDAFWEVEKLFMATGILWMTWMHISRHRKEKETTDTPAQFFLASSSFFLFASHRFFSAILTNLARNGQLPTVSSLQALTTYVTGTAVVIALCLVIYACMRRFLPRTTRILTGGR